VHIVQSPIWEKFKESYGTETVRVGGVLYTKHRIPFTNSFYAYCPKVDPFSINFEDLINSLRENDCIAVNFDVPNVLEGSDNSDEAGEIFETQGCIEAPRDTFMPYNLLLDLSPSEDDLLMNMHSKQRYNVRYAKKNGVTVKNEEGKEAFEKFYNLAIKTADRQGFYVHPKGYYEKLWEIMSPKGVAHILNAYYEDELLASWMFFVYEDVIYYFYGGSSTKHRNLQASTLVGWRGMLLGKELGCKTMDLWGACEDPNDRDDPEWGFTHFKQKFGAKHVAYIPSYDLVLNPVLYEAFNIANRARWSFLKLKKQIL
jgi:lipid II:glycine glycyltransferase (peptidoglycan interpeptide bridge formation enzyme)